MVIRLTVGDNKYTNVLKKFADRLIENLVYNINLDIDDLVTTEKELRRGSRIIGIINSKEVSDNERGYLIQQIRNAFYSYIRDKRNEEYISDNLLITITDSFIDKDENGEVVYWLSTSKIVIVQ